MFLHDKPDFVVLESVLTNPKKDHGNYKGAGGLKSKTFKERYEAKLEFPQPEIGGGEGLDIFWNNTLNLKPNYKINTEK